LRGDAETLWDIKWRAGPCGRRSRRRGSPWIPLPCAALKGRAEFSALPTDLRNGLND
jgi:hypothetical protein